MEEKALEVRMSRAFFGDIRRLVVAAALLVRHVERIEQKRGQRLPLRIRSGPMKGQNNAVMVPVSLIRQLQKTINKVAE